ncbi:DUF465 domain-containing protein [uncultured Algimonas sp.]|uniref:YdcH family protein n=1 Tax=uncultured Algimonas sp. TaxID=1547920 RepID=UPI0026038D41|nr:DUF465 domain-containing protein [uncultured Algimonas sp.]
MNDGPDNDGDTIPNGEDGATASETRALLDHLKQEHRRIDQEIGALIETGVADMLKVRRMKKIKLSIKDQIAYLENQLTPDIIA